MKLNQIVGIAKLFSDRKIPVDVEKFLEDEYYSSSKQKTSLVRWICSIT